MRILLVEDDLLLAKATALGLDQAHYVVDIAEGVQQALHFLSVYSYHIVLLDLGLVDGHGLEVLRHLKHKKINAGVLILTAQDQVQDRIAGLQAGADDFITKPYDIHEVEARIQAILRRMSGHVSDVIQYQNIIINLSTNQVFVDEKLIEMTLKEFHLLQLLIVNQGRVVSKRKIEDSFYAYDADVNSNVIQVYMHHLRKKIGRQIIRTVKGIGYIVDHERPLHATVD